MGGHGSFEELLLHRRHHSMRDTSMGWDGMGYGVCAFLVIE